MASSNAQTIGMILSLIREMLRYAPDALGLLRSIFASPEDVDSIIARLEMMASPEQIEAEVEAGALPEPWGTRRRWLALQKGAADALWFLIEAQDKLMPDSVPHEVMDEASDIHAGALAAYTSGMLAVDELTTAGFNVASSRLEQAVVQLGQIKAEVCPVFNKKDDEP